MKKSLSVLIVLSLLISVFVLSVWAAEKLGTTVAGAKKGSSPTSYVVDREVWRQLPGMEKRSTDEAAIHLPKFLLKSEDAKKANAELEDIVRKMKEPARVAAAEGLHPDEIDWYLNANFSIYQDDKILSVLVRHANEYESDMSGFIVYNFRLSDGKRLYDKDMAKLYGIEKEYFGVMEEAISRHYDILSESSTMQDNAQIYGFEKNEQLEALWDGYSLEAPRIYVDSSGELRFVVSPYAPMGTGGYPTTLPMSKYIPFTDKELCPIYIKMANELGIDWKDTSYKGLIVPLGEIYDMLTMEAVLARLDEWQIDFNNFKDIQMLLQLGPNPNEKYAAILTGNEAYLLVPRYKNSTISLLALDPEPEDEDYLIYFWEYERNTKPVLVIINKDDEPSTHEVTIRYRDDVFSFNPRKDSVNDIFVIPTEIYNAEELYPLEDWTLEQLSTKGSSPDMYEMLERFIPKG